MRALPQLGVLDAFLAAGAASDGVEFHPDRPEDCQLPTPRIAGPDVPGNGAIMRPVLARILADATRKAGANVRLGCTFTAFAQDAEGVDVSFSDGERWRYDLVIGADGLYSKVREACSRRARSRLQRPGRVARGAAARRRGEWHDDVDGPKIKPGLNPVSRDEMYLFVTEDRATTTTSTRPDSCRT
jgi:2-polyprenyl-6-methoxyphenol hydroxylase-like FAD-dependent oxidoreductase